MADIKKNLREIRAGYYLNHSDPLYWRKLLKFEPENEEAIYHVAVETEQNAIEHFEVYNLTKEERHLKLSERYMAQAKSMFKKALNLGYLPARKELLRLEQKPVAIEPLVNKKSKIWIIILLTLLVFVAAFLYFFFNSNYKTEYRTNTIQNSFALMIPYHVNKEKPATLPNLNFRQTMIQSGDPTEEALVNELLTAMKGQYQINNKEPILIRAISSNNKEVGLAFWSGGESPIEIDIYPNGFSAPADLTESQREATIVIRSALYQYVKHNGLFPPDLSVLTHDFPANYLTDLPKEPNSDKNSVVSNFDSTGGWVYLPQATGSALTDSQLKELVQTALKPNITTPNKIAFEPLAIEIAKESNTLFLISGETVIREFPVALGKNNLTPEGLFWVNRKMSFPDKGIPLNSNAYGSRAMELSNNSYAIHGTNDPENIGKNVSLGCIRLKNPDVEELYAMTPLYTPVAVGQKTPQAFPEQSNQRNNGQISQINKSGIQARPYNLNPGSKEENPVKDYHWSN